MKYSKLSLLLLFALLVGCTNQSEEVPSQSQEETTSVPASITSEPSTVPSIETPTSIEHTSIEPTSIEPTSIDTGAFPAPPSGFTLPEDVYDYYAGVNFSLSGQTLKVALHNKIKGHTSFSYQALNDTMRQTDRDWKLSPNPSDTNPFMVLIYASYNFSSTGTANKYSMRNTSWDKEHIWAKSHGGFGDNPPAGSDMHHLRASDKNNNSSRGNLDFGYAHSGATYVRDYSGNNSGRRGTHTGKGSVYEPMDIYKGDVARAIFYMATRYYDGNTGSNAQLTLVDSTTSSTSPRFGVLSALLEWHIKDPVDEFELNRNSLVQGYQKNRNPFIDFPSLADKVFG